MFLTLKIRGPGKSIIGGGGRYSYIHVLHHLFPLKVIVFTVCEHEYMNICPPTDQENIYDEVKFVNVSISSLGVFGESIATNTLFDMLHDLKYDEQRIKYVKKKIIATCIRTSYYIFCRRNKDWNNPELSNF
jgi:hypothetical protein